MLVYIYSLYSLILINENTVFPSFGFVIWYQSKFPNSSRVLFSFFQCCIFSFLFLIFLRKFPLFLRNFLFLRIVCFLENCFANNGFCCNEWYYRIWESISFFSTRFTNGRPSILASRRKSKSSSCYIAFNRWRELLSLGSCCEKSFGHQEQTRVHWWDFDSLITIGVYSFECAILDQMWQHGWYMANQFSLAKAPSKHHLWRHYLGNLEWLEELFCLD